jgi:riboflavin kinase / FMN adenylyltransferase
MIGNFDGVHLGHQRLINQLVTAARRHGGPAVVFTLDPHPAYILRPKAVPERLCWLERKAQLLESLGVDSLIAYPTDEAFLKLDPKVFFDMVICERLQARALVEGPNFHFGHDRLGDTETLNQWAGQTGIELTIVPPFKMGGQIISSSRIRDFILAGHMGEASDLLGRPHRIRGEVIMGDRRGRTLGFPTANLDEVDVLLPDEGTYAGVAWVEGKSWPAAINLGPCPTFGQPHQRCEVHLIGFEGDLYGQTLDVDFLVKLREIRRFESPDELVVQMQNDLEATCRVVADWSSK